MKKKKYKLKRKFYIPFLIIILSPFFIMGYKIFLHQSNNKKIEKALEKTEKVINNNDNNDTKYLEELKNMNNDFVGILTIPNTIINYPVMYTKSDYYLRRSFDKKQSDAGTLYIDKYNIIDPIDDNIIIYGHNMKNGTMFHELLNYKDEEYYKEHKYIYFNKIDNNEKYEIISVFYSKVYYENEKVFKYYKFYRTEDTIEFNDYVKNIKELSLYDTGIDAKLGDKFITLSTCEYSQENGRFVVVAKKI